MDLKSGKEEAKRYYDQEAGDYIRIYRGGSGKYPANLIRLNFIIDRLKQNRVVSILDAGCGTCGPMIRLLGEGFRVQGFDFSGEMVRKGRIELEKAGHDPGLIVQADIEDDSSLSRKKYDAILALGVFPHVLDERKALSTLRSRLKKNGLVFIEFRNDLFAAFTLNAYSLDFFMNRVIDTGSLPREVSDDLLRFYQERFQLGEPERREGGKITYSDILARFRNPLTIGADLFEPGGFSLEKLHFYHYHALPPVFEPKYPELFRELSLKMENPGDWRGYLMASAYVAEARKRG